MRLFQAVPTLLVIALFQLSACSGPVATTTKYEPPGTPGGRMCTNQCREAKDFCRKDCELELRRCTNIMQTQAIRDYESYAHDRLSSHLSIELQPRDFERPENCTATECLQKCEPPFKTCYKNCGGKIAVSSSCRFFCF